MLPDTETDYYYFYRNHYAESEDSDIVFMVICLRKRSLSSDIRRHQWKIFLYRLGFLSDCKNHEIGMYRAWVDRLQIIQRKYRI